MTVWIVDLYKRNWAVTRYSSRGWFLWSVVFALMAVGVALAIIVTAGGQNAPGVILLAIVLAAFALICGIQGVRARRVQ